MKQKLGLKVQSEKEKALSVQSEAQKKAPKLTANEYYIQGLKRLAEASNKQNKRLEDLENTVSRLEKAIQENGNSLQELANALVMSTSPHEQFRLERHLGHTARATTSMQNLENKIENLVQSYKTVEENKTSAQEVKESAQTINELVEALVWTTLWALLCTVIMLTSFGVALVVSTVIAWVVAGLVGLASVGWFATRFKKHLLDDGGEKPKKQTE